MAGRYWYLEEQKTPEMIEACSLFEKSMGNNANQIARALKFKGDNETIKKLCTDHIASSLQKKGTEKMIEEPVECAWRIRNHREVQVGKPDYELTNSDGSRFCKVTRKLLRNRKVQKVHHFSPISDLTIEFDEKYLFRYFS